MDWVRVTAGDCAGLLCTIITHQRQRAAVRSCTILNCPRRTLLDKNTYERIYLVIYLFLLVSPNISHYSPTDKADHNGFYQEIHIHEFIVFVWVDGICVGILYFGGYIVFVSVHCIV
jgi:hypothetical protein